MAHQYHAEVQDRLINKINTTPNSAFRIVLIPIID